MNGMDTVEIKGNLHGIIDRLEDVDFLKTLYDFLKLRDTSEAGKLFSSLSEIQKKEVLLSFEESEEDDNLVPREEVFTKNK